MILIQKLAKRGWLIAGGVAIVAVFWWGTSQPEVAEAEIVSRSGLHWHPELAIYIQGKQQDISGGIGLGILHDPVHTHDAGGVIHLEMLGLVRHRDIRLGQFFKVWEKTFNREQIFEYRNGEGGTVKMFVNGAPSNEFENYIIPD